MLIPLGHEQTSVRRLPWVTFGIMGLCLVVFILMAPDEHRNQMESFLALNQALGYYTQHPYLEMGERFRSIFINELGVDQASAFAEHMKNTGPPPPDDPEQLAWEQQQFDEMVSAYFSGIDDSILGRYGLVPADYKLVDLVTYQFLHAGWLHLLFNLLMLFVVAPFVEDVWGRPLFLGFYLSAGAVAGLMFAVRFPTLQMPLVGASGAIAGVMGAFLVRYFKARIRFLVWLGIPVGPFHAPAWIIFPIWFGMQLFSAQVVESRLPEGGGGVAFWAHVWGFVFGVVVAAAIRQFQVEEKVIDSAIESKVTMLDNTAVDRAISQARAGDRDGAVAALERELANHQENVDAAMALWNLCTEGGEPERAGPSMTRVIENAVRDRDTEFILAHWDDVLIHHPEIEIDPLLAVRLAEMLDGEQRVVSAVETLELGHARIDDATPIAVVLRIARMGLLFEAPGAGNMVQTALSHPELPPDARPELEVAKWGLARVPSDRILGQQKSTEPADEEDEGTAESKPILNVAECVPMSLEGSLLMVYVSGIVQQIELHDLQAVAVGVVAREDGKSVAVLDLMLEPPGANVECTNTFRIFGDSFEPRMYFEGDDAMIALRSFVVHILETSLATPLPDWESARGQPFRLFQSIEEYETEVLGLTS